MNQQARQPVKEFRAGTIKAAVWKNETEQNGTTVVKHSVRIQKRFRNDQGEWQDSNSYFPQDLPKLQLVIAKAFEFISLKESEES